MINTPEFWAPEVLWANVVASAVMALACFVVPIILFLMVHKRRRVKSLPGLIVFAIALVFVGLGFLAEIWVVLTGDAGLGGYVRPFMAFSAFCVVVALTPVMYGITSAKTPEELKILNEGLQEEISTQKAATEKLGQTEEKLRAYLEQAPEGMLIVRPAGLIEYSNTMVNTIFGRPAGDLTGKYLTELIPARSHHKIGENRNDLYETDGSTWLTPGAEFTGIRADGTEFPVEVRVTTIFSAFGGDVALSTYRDISDQKAREEEKRREHANLAHVSRLSTMGQMATGLAHELNQPLAAISNNLYAAKSLQKKMANPNPMMLEIIDDVYQSAQRAGEIIKSLRQLVSKDASSQREADINNLVRVTTKLIDPEARAAGVRLNLELEPLVGRVSIDPIQIQQVLVNLGRNAIEALSVLDQAERFVTISTALHDDKSMLVRVSDNGVGLSPSVRDDLFTPNLTTKESGMGLGLSICLSIIEVQGGELWHDDNHSCGATFCFTLPLAESGEN